MPTLIIHAPRYKARQEGYRSFDRTIKRRVGEGFAIPKADFGRLGQGDKVVVLSKDEKRRAEGTLVRLVPNGKTKTGMKKYDVRIRGLNVVKYKPERLGRTGVSVV
jgi:hypothetical protein